MKRSELKALVRLKLADQTAPYLWSDPFIDGELNEAVKEANLRARLIVDARTKSVCTITVSKAMVDAGTATFALDPSIIVVRRVEWAPSDGTCPSALRRRSFDELDRANPYWRTSTGQRPLVSVHDLQNRMLVLHPIPVATGVLNLIVWRHPLRSEEMCKGDEAPVIQEQHHRRLVEWVCSQLLLTGDADTQDPPKAQACLEAFEAEFGKRPSVQTLQRLAVDHEEETEPYYY